MADLVDEDRERAIHDVLAPSRRRPRSPRWLWIAALVVGVACAAAFVVALVWGGDAASTGPAPATTRNGLGFASGLALGVGLGLAIGWFAARRQSVSADDAGHSSRNRP